jgi:hypothetical protein
MINDVSAEIVNVVGWPGTRDRYRVDVRLPGGLASGAARLQLNGAYLPGVVFSLPVPKISVAHLRCVYVACETSPLEAET